MGMLEVKHLNIAFGTKKTPTKVVCDVSLTVERGEIVGLVGESGSGKTLTALAVMGLLPKSAHLISGTGKLDGVDLLTLTPHQMQKIQGSRIGIVFQDPFTSLNPTMNLGEQVSEVLRLHRNMSRSEARAETLELFKSVHIPDPEIRMRQYPHQVSGGQRQRVLIAMAFACRPELLIADEPTTALDVTVQAQVLALLQEMQQKLNTGVLLITHDLGVVASVCNRVLVMVNGRVVESGGVEEIMTAPKHPYTQALLAAVNNPVHLSPTNETVNNNGREMDNCCVYADRCPICVNDPCRMMEPELRELGEGHEVRCHLAT